MTAEDPKFGAVEIPWPTEVTPDDLAEIDAYRSQGKSLAAAVAWVIIDQARQLNLQLQNQPPSFPPTTEDPTYKEAVERTEIVIKMISESAARKLFDIPLLISGYITSAVIVLETEQAENGDESVSEEIYSQVLGESVSVLGVSSKNKSIEVEQVEPGLVMSEAEWILKRSQYATILREEGPLGLIDFYITELERRLQPRRRSRTHIEALKTGQTRFHQLYQSTQEVKL